ncbi:hypothetical protein BJ508DRAFT_417420 [Ascobolus immersus RN42]|uniref:Copper acquisition factor BIM1-like domain-containing protein n=1 Tax=Ascobolus immersus RN42 TaxID=1160509 RepID=A0A3N4HU71_ASCIM|nr:hypothetical protein BJ508DRAFT_417420 [Ascobolus immersus RN42]
MQSKLALLTFASIASAFNLTYPPSRGTNIPPRTEPTNEGPINPCGPFPPSKHRTPFPLNGRGTISFTSDSDASTVYVGFAINNSDPRNPEFEDFYRVVDMFFQYGKGDFCWDPLIPLRVDSGGFWDPKAPNERVKNGTDATILVMRGRREGMELYKHETLEYACADVVLVDGTFDSPACKNGTGVSATDFLFGRPKGATWQMKDNRAELAAEWQKQYNSTGEFGKEDEQSETGEKNDEKDDSGAGLLAIPSELMGLSLMITGAGMLHGF